MDMAIFLLFVVHLNISYKPNIPTRSSARRCV